MVCIVGTPAESNFGQVTSTDDNTAFLVAEIHEDLRTFTSLDIFVGHVRHCRIVSDVFEVLHASLGDVDRTESHAEAVSHIDGIVLRALRRAEPRHGHGNDVGSRTVEKLERFVHDQQGERGVKATRQAENGMLDVARFETLCEASALDVEDFGAAFCTSGNGTRNERSSRDKAMLEFGYFANGFGHCGAFKVRSTVKVLEGTFADALHVQTLNVDIGIDNFGFARELVAFGKLAAVFSNDQVTTAHHVCSRFVYASGCVHVASHATCGLVEDKVTTVVSLTDKSVACGQVHDNIGPSQCKVAARRIRSPQVFTEFTTDDKFAIQSRIAADTDEVGHRNITVTTEFDRHGPCKQVATTGKVAFFIELALVRQMDLRRNSLDVAILDKDCAVIEAAMDTQRSTNYENRVYCVGKPALELFDRIDGVSEKSFLVEQVITGVPGNAEFWEYNDPRAFGVCFLGGHKDFSGIVFGVSHLHFWANRSEAVEAKFIVHVRVLCLVQ